MEIKTSLEQRTENSFYAEETSDSYRLHNVPCDGALWIYDWDKELLDNGRADLRKRFITKYSGQMPSTKDYFVSFAALHRNMGRCPFNPIEKIRNMFDLDFRNRWMHTNTRLQFNLSERTVQVIHNYNSERETRITIDHCLDGYLGKTYPEEQMDVLLGIRNLNHDEVFAVFNWITGNKIKPTKQNVGTFWPHPLDGDVRGERWVYYLLNRFCYSLSYHIMNYDFWEISGYARGVRVERREAPRAEQKMKK